MAARSTIRAAAGASAAIGYRGVSRRPDHHLLNPKVGVFYLSVLPQFLPQGNAALGAAVLGGIHAAEGVVWFAVIIVAITRVRAFLARPVVARRLDRVVGVVFLGFGARLLLAQGR